MRETSYLYKLMVGVLLLLACLLLSPVMANTVTISKVPPSVINRVAPNVVLTFDDSGSMNSTSIPDDLDADYKYPYYYSSDYNGVYYNPKIKYLIPPAPNGVTMVIPSYTKAPRDGYCASIGSAGCWSPNASAYLPSIQRDLSSGFYLDFLSNIYAGNSPCPRNANESGWYNINTGNCDMLQIPVDVRQQITTTSTSTNTSQSVSYCLLLFCPSGSSATNGSTTVTITVSNCLLVCMVTTVTTTTSTVTSKQNDPGGFYYTCSSRSQCIYHSLSQEGSAAQANFAIWYSYYRTRNLMARAAVGRVFSELPDGSVRVAFQTLQSQAGSMSYFTSNSAYKGFGYGPLALIGASGGSPSKILPLLDSAADCSLSGIGSESCWRTNFMNWVYGVPASGSTPTREALQTVNKFYRQALSATTALNRGAAPFWNDSASQPAELSCRKNFNMLVTDGYWNADSPATPSPKDTDSFYLPDGASYVPGQKITDVYSNDSGSMSSSLANIAFSGWAADLRSDLKDNVPSYFPDLSTGITSLASEVDSVYPGRNHEVYFNPNNDPATWQHVSEYMVTLGADGTLVNNASTLLSLRTGGTAWPAPNVNGGATNIDDTWHAAINSRGGYFSASDPDALYKSLGSILSSVIASTSSSQSVSLSAQTLTTQTSAFAAGYNTSSWSGTLTASSVLTTGELGNRLWDAGQLLDGLYRGNAANAASTWAKRVMVTTSGAGSSNGIALPGCDLTLASAAAKALGQNFWNWLCGDAEQEGLSLRSRTSLLGPIFNSQPVYVGAPDSGLSNGFPSGSAEANALKADPSQAYSVFVSSKAARVPMVYVGANDGMLHAFDATAGKEKWAFVPSAVYSSLLAQSQLNNYTYTPTVDGTPVEGDVFFSAGSANKGWHTILVGGLRYGGRGVYAIDVTDPGTMTTATQVASKVLWEFTSDSVASAAGSPANLGYTFGIPSITRLATGVWAVIVPAGYFPDGSTAAAAKNAYSSLFVLNAQTGALIKEIRTPAGVTSYGLSTVALGDYDGDQVADVGFGGDIAGNLWRFDLSQANLQSSNPSAGVQQIFAPAQLAAQSITVQPRLVADPTSAYFMVVFGTGRFLSTADAADTNLQAIYGLRDPGPSAISKSPLTLTNLVKQSMRISATGQVGVSAQSVPPTAGGWYLPLDQTAGERVVVNPFLDVSADTVAFTTLVPATNDPCSTSLGGSFLALDAATGSAAAGGIYGSTGLPTGFVAAGSKVSNVPSSGSLSGGSGAGGRTYFPGLKPTDNSIQVPAMGAASQRRRSWRILNNYEN